MPELVLHPHTREAMEALLKHRSHAILIAAPVGAGKYSLARHIAASHLSASSDEALSGHPYFTVVTDEKSISIDAIRTLQRFLSLRTTGKGDVRRVVIIEDAHTMTEEAQNALLKLLEEPPADTVIILTTSSIHGIRETIRSRAQQLLIQPVDKALALTYFVELGYKPAAIERNYLMSGGLMGLTKALLEDDKTHPFAAEIDYAKQLYGMSTYDRLRQVEELYKQKERMPQLFAAMKRISASALEQAALKGQETAVRRWHQQLKLASQAETNLRSNPNMKLLLTDLFLEM